MAIMPLTANILIAMPGWKDTIYEKSIIFVCEHHEQGTVGLILNRPTTFSLSYICEQLHVDCEQSESKNMPLLFGGPIQPERGFVLHRPFGDWRSSLVIQQNDVTLTTSNDVIKALAENKGPDSVMIALGYSGWDAKKLEEEIINDMWMVCPFKSELLYDIPYAQRWSYAGSILGVNFDLVSGSGHA
ncbi:MAG: DUF179 domain-containing protein [Gammaproteobacteria bacterium]|jgi:putative transcriptional regulator|nr:DUF179 domain-containing protein [Gammaproteobacteria bacterium]